MNKLTKIIIGTAWLPTLSAYADEANHNATIAQWDGFYLGASLGSVYSKASPSVITNQDSYFVATDEDQLNPEGSESLTGSDVGASVTMGFNFQDNNIVYGVEGYITLARFSEQYDSGEVTYLTNSDIFSINTKISSDWLINLRAKVGYTFDNSLIYVAAGPSLTKLKYQFSFSDSSQSADLNKSKTALGFNIGAGYEYKINNQWSLKADYTLSYFNNVDYGYSSLSGVSDGFNHDLDVKNQLFRIGFNRYF